MAPREGKQNRSSKGGSNKRNNNSVTQTPAAAKKGAIPEEDDDVTSINSDVTCSTNFSDEEDEVVNDHDLYETSVKTAIEFAQEKSVKMRLKGILDLKKILQTSNPEVGEVLLTQYVTICDIVERSVKRGSTAAEKIAATQLGTVLLLVSMCLMQGTVDEIYQLLQPTLLIVCQDTTVTPTVREEVCRAVAVMAYFGAMEYTDLQESINTLHSVFSKALPKGDGELPTLKPATLLMHSAALQGFHLLLTLTRRHDMIDRAPSLLEEMMALLETRDLEMRCEGGMGIALIYELARGATDSANFRWKRERDLRVILNELATDSHKHRGKKERKQQRQIFRSILIQVEENEFEDEESVEFRCKRARGYLHLDSWALKFRYDSVCHVLEQGINTHFIYNSGLRASFELSPDDLILDNESKANRNSNRRVMGAVHKKRHLDRNKKRDNRTSDFNNIDEEE